MPTLNFLLDNYYLKKAKLHSLSMILLTQKQCSKIKSLIVDSKNCLNEVFSFFYKLYKELSLRFYLVNTLPDYFLFHIQEYDHSHQKKLDKIFDNSISNPNTIIVISDTSIKNNVATSILYIL